MKALFIEEIGKKMEAAMKSYISENEHSAYIDHEAGDFYFTVETNEDDEVEVTVLNVETDKENYPRIIEAITAAIPCWSDVADKVKDEDDTDEWNEHGFRNAEDYWRTKC